MVDVAYCVAGLATLWYFLASPASLVAGAPRMLLLVYTQRDRARFCPAIFSWV